MKNFEKCGVQELTSVEQREALGGNFPWRALGKAAGVAMVRMVRWTWDVLDYDEWLASEVFVPMPEGVEGWGG